jgi:hypothetical protein
MHRSFTRSTVRGVALLCTGVVLGALSGCSSMVGGDDCPTLSSACPATPPSWESDVQPIVLAYCTQCHGKGGVEQPVFDSTTYQSVFVARSEIATVTVNCSMPPSGSSAPDAAQRQTLLSWIACGAPDN